MFSMKRTGLNLIILRTKSHFLSECIVPAVLACLLGAGSCAAVAQQSQEITIGIGTQNMTTNTVTGGVVIKELKLMEKYLPHTGKYQRTTWKLDWQNFTSGPPITNGMIADRMQIGMMGDYPLLVNGATGQHSPGNETELIAIIAYNAYGSGNGVVVNKDSPYYELSDLKGKNVSVPFGSAAHGMLMLAMQQNGWPENYWNLVNQSPEVGTSNLQEKKIDAHADFVPFAELLPYRGFARKIFDGVQTRSPTFHGVVVRKDFAEKYPEAVVAYLRALMDANDWVRKDPVRAARKIEEWTHIEKEVAYLYLGPDGIHTLDPTIKPLWLDAIKKAHIALSTLGRIKEFDEGAWVNDTYLRQAFKERGDDYDAQKQSMANYDIQGTDPICGKPITHPSDAGEIWLSSGDMVALSSPVCTLMGVRQYEKAGKKIDVVYLMDKELGIKLFADKAFFAINVRNPKAPQVEAFLLKKDAETYAAKTDSTMATYSQAIDAVGPGSSVVAK